MRRILSSRLFRCLVCLVLICALLINVSPIKARADVVTGGIVIGGAVISVPVAIAVGATLICLGIVADAASENPYALEDLASEVGNALSTAGTYVKDGMVEMYRFVTDTGEVVYYAAADFMEAVRSWAFDSGTLSCVESYVFPGYDSPSIMAAYAEAMAFPFHCVAYNTTSKSWHFIGSDGYIDITDNGQGGYWIGSETHSCTTFILSSSTYTRSYISKGKRSGAFINITAEGLTTDVVCTDGFTLGVVLTTPIDGTSARTWSEAYANRGLYIASGGSQGDPDDGAEGNNNWRFLLPLALVAGADLWAMSQADQWTGQTPQEFDDYTTQEELTVTPAPEFDGYTAIEIAPAPNTNPDPGTDPDVDPDVNPGTDPDSGGDSAELTWWQRFTQWFLDLRTSINELPNKFDEHFENLNNNIDEVPSKFQSWISDLKTSINTIPDKIVQTASDIKAAILAVPDAIVNGIKSILPNQSTESESWNPPSDANKFTLDLKQYFPFCIPFDLYAFFTCLNADPVAPVIEWLIPLPGGKTYPFEIDLSVFDPVAQILRRMELLLFCVGLAFKTRDLIKG